MSTTYDVEFRRPITVQSKPQMSDWRLERAGLDLEHAKRWKGENDDWAERRKTGVETRIVKVTREVVE